MYRTFLLPATTFLCRRMVTFAVTEYKRVKKCPLLHHKKAVLMQWEHYKPRRSVACVRANKAITYILCPTQLSLRGFTLWRFGRRNRGSDREGSILVLSMRRTVVVRCVPCHVSMVVRSNGSSLCAVEISWLFKSLASTVEPPLYDSAMSCLDGCAVRLIRCPA